MRERSTRERQIFRIRLTRFNPTRTRGLTRRFLPIPATLPAVLGTDLKLGSRPSHPRSRRRRKLARTPAIELGKSRLRSDFVAVDSAGFVTRHHLELVPHISSNNFRPTTIIEDAGNSPNDHRKLAELRSFDPPPAARVATHGHHRSIHRGRN